MIVTIDYVKGPEPSSETFTNVTEIRTVQCDGYKRLVIDYKSTFVEPATYSTPMYLIHNIEIKEGD